jgi:uncharacterized protein (TIGR01619 family)
MGLFANFFGTKKNGGKGEAAAEKIPRWEFYFSNVEGVLASFMVDLSLHETAPVAGKTNIVWLSIQMNNPREDGLASDEEFEKLNAMEYSVVQHFYRTYQAVYPGRVTTNGRRDIYFYLGDTSQYDKTVAAAMAGFPEYKFSHGSREDAAWKGYFNFLYPSPDQLQSIKHRNATGQPEKNDASPSTERQVDHWIYFETEKDRQDFIFKIKDDNLRIINAGEKTLHGDKPYKLHISSIDNIDNGSADKYAVYLWLLAQEHNGAYSGGETPA